MIRGERRAKIDGSDLPKPRQGSVGRFATTTVNASEVPESVKMTVERIRVVGKDARKASALAALALVAALTAACANGSGGDSGGLTGGDASAQASIDTVIFGSECFDRPDVYQEGMLNISDGRDNLVQSKLDNLSSNIQMSDGPLDYAGRTPAITDFPDATVEQLRQSILKQTAAGPDALLPARVNAYGKPDNTDNTLNVDGRLNEGLGLCAG